MFNTLSFSHLKAINNFPLKNIISVFLFTLSYLFTYNSHAQINEEYKGFKDYYPISVRPYLSGGIGNNAYESILLDAEPVVYYGIYNDIHNALTSDTIGPGDAIYISVQPQLRLYSGESKPVKMPTYKVLFGWQRILSTASDNFITAAIETGHYSNGQSGAAFSTAFEDNSEGGNAAYQTITDQTDLSAILNRENGNFSTNLTRISLNYRINNFDDLNKPLEIHSFTLTYQVYHNKFMGIFSFGGYNPNDIALMGRHQIEAGYEYTGYFKKIRYSLGQKALFHFNSHPSTKFYRSESTAIIYPWDSDLGFMTQFSFGFDDYNYRFVDHFPRLSIGVTWDWFTPFVVKNQKE